MSFDDDRAKAFEDKYAHDLTMKFKIHTRTSKLFGLWAAAEMDLQQEARAQYAAHMIETSLNSPTLDVLVKKVTQDFSESGVNKTINHISFELDKCLKTAEQQVLQG